MSNPELIPSSTASVEPARPTPAPVYTAFRGPNGIRAGWRVLIFLLLAAAMVAAVAVMARLVFHGRRLQASSITPLALIVMEGLLFLFAAVPALIMARIEHRRWAQYGLPLRQAFRKDFWVGSAAGFFSISGCLFGMFVLRGFHLTGLAIHGSTMLSATAAWSVTFVLVGLAEEFSFRGYLQYTLTTGIGFWPSAIVLSTLFALGHAANPGETKFGLFSVFLFGILFCFFLRRCGNIWLPVGFHAGWDWGQTFFYGVPDSGIAPYHSLFNSGFSGPPWLTGGSVGPEASVFTPIVLAIAAVLFRRVYREDRYVI